MRRVSRPNPPTLEGQFGDTTRQFGLERPLAMTRFSTVWLGHEIDSRNDKRLAIKIYRPGTIDLGDPGRSKKPRIATGQWLSEAKALFLPQHPNRVSVHYVGKGNLQDSDGSQGKRAFTVMSYQPGWTLEQAYSLWERFGTSSFYYQGFSILDFCEGILGALETIHQHGFLYTDLKPANIILSPGRKKPVLIDPGGLYDRRSHLVAWFSNDVFSSPEQARARAEGLSVREEKRRLDALTPASDLCSLGLLLRGMESWNAELRIAMKIPRGVANLMQQSTQIDPRRRPQSIREALDILRG